MSSGQAGTVGRRIEDKRNGSVGWNANVLWVLALASLLLLNGCAGLISGKSQTPPPTGPSFAVSPLSLNFGKVANGQKVSQTMTLTNTGGVPVTVQQPTFSNPQFSFSGMTFPATLAVGQGASVTIWLTGSTNGAASGTITFQGDSGTTPAIGNLSGTVAPAAPQIVVAPASVDFGNVTVGSKGTASLVISNGGTTDLTISMLTLNGAEFGISGISTPRTISAGQSVTAVPTFSPTATGTVTGSISITSNDPANPTATVTFSGTGSTQALGQLKANPTSVSFGNVASGSSATETITLSNSGNASLQISSVVTAGAGFTVSGLTAPATLGTSQTATLTVKFAPTTVGSATGTITLANNGNGSSLTIPLSGTGTAAPEGQLTANPTSWSFGGVASGSNSTKTITLTNTGNASLTISSVVAAGAGFSVSGVTTPASLAASQSATLTVKFAPTSLGSVTGSITVSSNGAGSPLTIGLSGTGTAAPQGELGANPASLSFGSVSSGSNSTQTITLTNLGNASLQVSSIVAAGSGFSVSGVTTPLTLTNAQSATLTVKFAPTSTGTATGSITITSNGVATKTVIALSGTGTAAPQGQLSANPASLGFGTVAAGSNSLQNITLTNSGNAAVHISAVSASGTGFTVSGVTVPLTLNASQTATLSVKFAPTAAGAATGTIQVASDAPGSPLTINLTGTGTQAGLTVSPATFGFGSVVDGQTKSQNFTITNSGSASLTVTQIAASGAGYSASGLNTPATIAVGQSATFSVLFAPATAGALGGSVTIASNAPNSPNTVSLTGTGVAASVTMTASPVSLAFGTVSAGGSMSKSVTVTNSGNANVTISQISVNAKDVTASGITTPMTLTPGQNAALNLAFKPVTAETVSGNVTIMSSQGTSAVVPLTGSGVQAGIALTPSTVNFGNTTVGSPNSQTIQLSNTGTATLTVSQLSVTGSGFTTSTLGLPLSLNPGANTTFNVQFGPQSAGSVSGSVSILSNAPTSPNSITLSGTGIAATTTISLSSATLSFGSVNTGSSASHSVTITNTGNSNATISGITITGTGYSLGGASTPISLSPSQTTSFNVLFAPTAAGSDAGSVTVASNATGSPATVALSGTGVAPVQHSVALNWNASTSTVSGYNVYRSSVSGSGYAKVNSSLVGGMSYTDSSVQGGQTYFYVTTAVDGSGNESSYSNEASANIP